MISSSKIPFGLPEQPSNPFTQDFDYAALDAETRIVVQQRTSEIKSLIRHTAQDTFEIGEKLIEVKQKLGHGYFGDWLKAEFDWGEWTARKFMQVARKFKSVKFTDLDIAASALYILAANSTPEAARLEALERASLGEPISHSKAKVIKAKASARQHKPVTKFQPDEPVTIDIDAKTVEQESSTGGKIPEASLSWQHGSGNSVAVENSEEELLGKEAELESPQSKISNSEQAIPEGELNSSVEDQRMRPMERESISVTEICKSLIANIEYLHREDIVDLIDPLSLKSLMQHLTILFEKTEVSLKKRCDSSYFNV